ncbi:hypothetical protein IFM89_026816 [Coptis chinensis]|uniref:Protein kinase domain-containing protein n=1 Tax=Coptis chinensis TaxID=261450 RepID=A0A835IBJ8_9MAGN|nr:hypothetical protein IFM89_026816 [Coptis chinensis]
MAVKSVEISDSCTLQKEREILRELEQRPYILRCYGEEFTDEKNGDMVYNLLLEYASGGTLAEVVKNSNNAALSELEIRRYTKSILRGLNYIHENGYVHLVLI